MNDVKLIAELDDFKIIEYTDINGDRLRGIFSKNSCQSITYTDYKKFELYKEYYELYDHYNTFHASNDYTLVLGGGGFTFPKYFINKYKDKKMDVIEYNPKMIELATKYFYVDELDKNRLNIKCEDAKDYVEKCNKKYDSIIMDLYEDEEPIQLFLEKEFTKSIKKLLKQDGYFGINYIYNDGKEDKIINYLNSLHKEFKNVKVYSSVRYLNKESYNVYIICSDKEIEMRKSILLFEIEESKFTDLKQEKNNSR